MFSRSFDIVTIGDTTTDAFIRLKEARIGHKPDDDHEELCLPFGDKVPFEYVKVIRAVGNAANVSSAAERLGLRSALVSNIGDDENGRECLVELRNEKIDTSFVKINRNKPTNYNFILWYENDRTILVNHTEYDYALPRPFSSRSSIKAKWLYLTSLPENSLDYHLEIADYLSKNPEVKLAFQPGTFQLMIKPDQLPGIYNRIEVMIINMDEARELASSITGKDGDVATRQTAIGPHPKTELKITMRTIANHGPKIVIVTDGPNGAYMFDGDHYYFMPIYPDPRPAFERTGCGDAFSATFVASLSMGCTPLEALVRAPVNPMSVAQFVGSKEGLLPLDQLEWWLNRAPDEYKPREI